MFKKVSLQVKISLVILIPLLIMIAISNIINIIYVQNISEKLSYKILEEVAKGEGNQLSAVVKEDLYQITGLKYTLENMYNSGVTDRKTYESVTKNFFNILPNTVIGVMIALEPNAIGNDANYTNDYPLTKGQQTYYISRSSANAVTERSMSRDEIDADYYNEPIAKRKEYLSGIYEFNLGNNDIVSMYTWAIPIMYQNKPIGVITADIKIETLNETMKNIQPFEHSEGLLFDHYGNLMYDMGSTENLGKNMYDIYPKYKDHNVFETLSKGQTISFEDYTTYYKGYATYYFIPLEIAEGQYWILEIMAANSDIFKDSDMMRNVMIIISLIIIVIASIIVPIILKHKVTSIIVRLSKSLLKISNGDISFHINNDFLNMNDEWGDIAKSCENILNNLNKVVTTVKRSAEQVSTAANQVLAGNNDLSQRTESQASSLEETAASMNEMASAIKESAESVAESTNMVTDAKDALNNTGLIIEESVNKMNDVHEASTKIMDITKLIENIAFQTNILALNASVEAARAGDQGKGFAVVASEVRNLAQNTQESVKNITALITDSNDKANLAAKSVQESKEMFNDILQKMDNASMVMDKINTAAQEQERGIDQVNIAISNMDSAVQKNAALVEEATAASQSLLSEANELIKVIEYFKLRN
ncbi:methyl-accepting chemotaxis protein [Brachyspira innocens]|uniref:methyl-accepting chemotaxis protein n=1 Tax=Brachyspira innocens TaxID=13264 RepID=UPI0004784ED1|nr:methyl-accepting chemotaxis protein [Brachyspira innocens]